MINVHDAIKAGLEVAADVVEYNSYLGGDSTYAHIIRAIAANDDTIAAIATTLPGAVPIGVSEAMPGAPGFTMAAFKADEVPVGTDLYAAPVAPALDEEREDAARFRHILDNPQDWFAAWSDPMTMRDAVDAGRAALREGK